MKTYNDNQLESLTKKIKQEADALLKKSDLLNFLSKYGETSIQGSYELDLMLDGDIDIYVINNKIDKDLVIKILEKLIRAEKFNGYFFYDFYKKTRKCFPKGYYIGLKTAESERKWKLDLWFMKSMDKKSGTLMNSIKNKLNDKNRKQILKLKYYSKSTGLDISSHLIYLAVIEQGITTIKDFKKNIEKIKSL